MGINGGAIYFGNTGNVENCNFTNNSAVDGGAVYFVSDAEVTNCNFTGNTGGSNGGSIWMSSGSVTNCNFTNNSAGYGGAVYFNLEGTVTNCNFTNNAARGGLGGAIYMPLGSVENCNFVNNFADHGGAVSFWEEGTVTNCNFAGNTADYYGGAVYFRYESTVTNCSFNNNKVIMGSGSAVYFNSNGSVINCNFTGNEALDGGAVYFNSNGSVTNCNFANNRADVAGAIFSEDWYTAADTCIFKTESDTTNEKVIIVSPKLNVDNFITFYGSGEKLTFNLTTDSGMPVNNGNISISVYFKDNNSWVGNYSCLSGEGWAVSLPVGSYYANFTTEYEGFQAISRTITITIPNVRYYINVTSLATNNKTVNITAKSDIPKDILWDGKLLFMYLLI